VRLTALAAVFAVCAAPGAVAPGLDAIFAPLANGRTPGMAVLVRQNGRTVAKRGYGVRELRTFPPVDARTNFRLASFTKQFTAMAVMLLVGDGKLSYETRLSDVFPGFPSYGRSITVRHLLNHTSGLPDYEDLMDGGGWSETRQISDDEVLELLERQPRPKFAAGTSWAYSNSAYVVLGLMVRKASGMRFENFLDARIFKPLHMNHTVAFINGRNSVAQRAYGHSKQGGEFVETDQSSTSAALGDGGVYSNLEDLEKWDDALTHHTLLSEAAMRPAWTVTRLSDGSATFWPTVAGGDNLAPGKPVSYGFGWFLDPYNGRTRVWHSGSTQGFRTAIERFTDERLTVIVLANRTDVQAPELALKVADAQRAAFK